MVKATGLILILISICKENIAFNFTMVYIYKTVKVLLIILNKN